MDPWSPKKKTSQTHRAITVLNVKAVERKLHRRSSLQELQKMELDSDAMSQPSDYNEMETELNTQLESVSYILGEMRL